MHRQGDHVRFHTGQICEVVSYDAGPYFPCVTLYDPKAQEPINTGHIGYYTKGWSKPLVLGDLRKGDKCKFVDVPELGLGIFTIGGNLTNEALIKVFDEEKKEYVVSPRYFVKLVQSVISEKTADQLVELAHENRRKIDEAKEQAEKEGEGTAEGEVIHCEAEIPESGQEREMPMREREEI